MLFRDDGFYDFATMPTYSLGENNVQYVHVDFRQFNDLMGVAGVQTAEDYF